MNLDLDIATVSSGAVIDLDFGPELLALTDALTIRTDEEPTEERAALVDTAGEAVAERAIAACATFQMMNRLLDGVGAPVSQSLHQTAMDLGFNPADLPR